MKARIHVLHDGSIPACAGEPLTVTSTILPLRVYPRVCGGTNVSLFSLYLFSGLSPRVRGNRADGHHPVVGDGSIPACAGEPCRWAPPRRWGWVYPRVCGGTVRSCCATIPPERSIPACAGEPPPAGPRWCWAGVYPRVCGGTRTPWHARTACTGLSPRVRGNRDHRIDRSGPRGSIPACAGEPLVVASLVTGVLVYPRVCGGTPTGQVVPPAAQGLSPRVRGNP